MSKEKSKEVLSKELSQKLKQLNDKEQLEGLIKDNKIPFEIKGIKYRVHKPTQAEGLEVSKARTKKYIEFLKDDTYMIREQLIDLYKGKGVDIKQLEEDIKEIGLKIEDIQETTNDPPSVYINLQIHISADANPDQIEKIFQNISKYLYRKS